MSAEPPRWVRSLADAVQGTVAEDYITHRPATGPDGRLSAVLILLGEGRAGPDVLLIQRADDLRAHAGQPAFPGGAADPGELDPGETALREAAEEVGLDPAGVRVVAVLPRIFLPPSGFVVTPVLAWWHTPAPVGVVDRAEVARVERVPVAELVDPANRCRIRHPSGHVGPAFLVRGMTVWGFTGLLLDRLLDLGGWAVPWDVDEVRDLPPRDVALAARELPAGSPGRAPEHDGPAADDIVPRAGDQPYGQHTGPAGTFGR